jgi:GxxExxY protein
MFKPIPAETEAVAARILDAAFQVHRTLGPGLLESVYETCVCHELTKAGIEFRRQLVLPIVYDGIRLDAGLRLDLLVADSVIVELKAIESLLPIHEAQLITYLKLANKRLGLLFNFNVSLLKNGFKRIVL